jgi:thioredoxin reductase (NADPH)
VLLATGFRADMRLLEEAGVEIVTPQQRPVYDERTMETNVPGLYVAGTATGGTQERFAVFIETSHLHVEKIVCALTGRSAGMIPLADAKRFAVAPSELES